MTDNTLNNDRNMVQCYNCHEWYEEYTTHSCIKTPSWTGYMKLKKRTPEELLDYLVNQFAIMRVELDQIEKKFGMKEPPKPFKKKPPKGQKSL